MNIKNDVMDLFSAVDRLNILPYDGEAIYHGRIFNDENSHLYLEKLLNSIEWKNDEAKFFGKHIITKRKVAWYGDAHYAYTYSNATKQALPWTNDLLLLKNVAEKITSVSFNSCLLNLYHTGEEGMAWHSDDEKSLEKNSSIASVTFGAVRKFSFKHKETKQTISIVLENGSLLEMKGDTQINWLHCLPKSKKIKQPRINLTFRTMAS